MRITLINVLLGIFAGAACCRTVAARPLARSAARGDAIRAPRGRELQQRTDEAAGARIENNSETMQIFQYKYCDSELFSWEYLQAGWSLDFSRPWPVELKHNNSMWRLMPEGRYEIALDQNLYRLPGFEGLPAASPVCQAYHMGAHNATPVPPPPAPDLTPSWNASDEAYARAAVYPGPSSPAPAPYVYAVSQSLESPKPSPYSAMPPKPDGPTAHADSYAPAPVQYSASPAPYSPLPESPPPPPATGQRKRIEKQVTHTEGGCDGAYGAMLSIARGEMWADLHKTYPGNQWQVYLEDDCNVTSFSCASASAEASGSGYRLLAAATSTTKASMAVSCWYTAQPQ